MFTDEEEAQNRVRLDGTYVKTTHVTIEKCSIMLLNSFEVSLVVQKRKGRKMKKTIVYTISAILVTMLSLSIVLQANAFIYPGNPPTEDAKYNNFGPMTSNLLLSPYSGGGPEFLAFQACDIDFMDWALTAAQLATLNTIDPTQATYSRMFYIDRGMREFDLNNMRFPTDDVQFRKALSYMFDKQTFCTINLAGFASVMWSPLENHGAWNNAPYCFNLYPFSLATANATLTAAGYTDKDADGWREGPAPGNLEIMLDVYCRSDDPDRDVMGSIMCANIRACGIQTNEQHQPRSVCRAHCMMNPFDYNIYTGGWSFGRDPDTLYSLYQSDTAQAFDGCPNYPGYISVAFDLHAAGMLTSAVSGIPYVYPPGPAAGTAAAHVWEMQRILMDDAGVIPVFTYASYGSYKTGWSKAETVAGVGPWGYYSLLNTFKAGDDTINWGQYNDISDCNPIYSQWVWDWNLLGLMYDSLISVNPYDVSEDLPWLAKSWQVGTWNYTGATPSGEEATTILFKLREDVYWHDIPALAGRNVNGTYFLTAGAKNVPFTADDVVFSIYTCRDDAEAWNNALVLDVVYAEKLDPYTVKVYMDIFMPLFALHWVGGLPIIPKHAWETVVKSGNAKTFDPIANQLLSGTGPWKLDYGASLLHEYYMLRANTRFFRYAPVDIVADIDMKRVDPCTTVTMEFFLHNMDSQRDPIPPSEFTITITKYYPNGTIAVLYSASNPSLPFCKQVSFFNYTEHIGYGKYNITATITQDPLTGHADEDGYPVIIWGTIKEDINMDFYVNGKDGTLLGTAFGTKPGDPAWNPAADINHDGFVNAKDAVKIGTQFGYPGP